MITKDQLSILKDIFAQSDEDWLLDHIELINGGDRNFAIKVFNGNWQDCDELFPGAYSVKEAPKSVE